MTIAFPPPPVAGGYVSFPVQADPVALFKQAVKDIQAQFPAWQPKEGQLDVAILEEVAQMAAATAVVATQVPISIFMAFGQIVGVFPKPGTAASAPITVTMVDTAGYTIPAGTVFGYPQANDALLLFKVQSTITVPEGQTTATGTIVCDTVGTFANGLADASLVQVTGIAQLVSVVTTAATSGGVDPDTQWTYINRLAAELSLLSPRPIVPADFSALAANVEGVFRAVTIDGLYPGRSFTDGVTTSNTVLTSATANFTPDDLGRSVTGGTFPAGTIVQTLVSTTEVETNNAASGSATGVHITLGDLVGQERCVTVCGVDVNGAALSSDVETALDAYLQAMREVNFIVSVIGPTTTEVDVTVACFSSTGANPSTVQAAIVAALESFLNPATWGGGASQIPQWDPTSNVVRLLDIASVIRAVPGVSYIPSGSLFIGAHGGTLYQADYQLPGDAPLASAGTINVVVTGD